MIENQNAGVTQKKKKYGRLKGFICFFVAAFISFSQVSPIWAAEGTRVFDEAGLFSAEEVQELETRIDEVRDSQDADLAVLTVEDAQGESAESYADDFYDTHGLGVGDDASGILLSIDMDNREIYVSTTGYAMKVLTDARVEKVLDAAYDSVADGNYAEGALGAIDSIENYLEMGVPAGQYTQVREEKKHSLEWYEVLFAAVSGVAAVFHFREETFFKEHPEFSFTAVGEKEKEYCVVSVLETDKYAEYYSFTDYGNEEDYCRMVEKILSHSKFQSEAAKKMKREIFA